MGSLCTGMGESNPAPPGGVLVGAGGQRYMGPGPGGALPPVDPRYGPQTVTVAGAFDSGARFDAISPPSIPPPPPGMYPTAAQSALAQGYNVNATQQQSDIMTGGTGGGYTVW